ncbi:uncharacterized protein LOC115999498 [Ipomoea triloba]|uniref:uncharacterized protein LOC115999498 n=1 Tax=Ipomoea triloba TaxID=35885 RepID=UPI00125E9D66|nr:uncharacterized protein LOC115999498 [Ipomoea triloba]
MTECKPLATLVFCSHSSPSSKESFDNPTRYHSLLGALQYLTVTRPNLSFVVNQLCQHMHSQTVEHWGLLKRALRYVKDQKSTSGFVVFLGSNMVSWVCRKQHIVAWSSTEAEYKGLANVVVEVTWIVSLLRELDKTCGGDYHFVCDEVASSELQVNFISTRDKLADIFTKALSTLQFEFLRDKLNVVPSHPCA